MSYLFRRKIRQLSNIWKLLQTGGFCQTPPPFPVLPTVVPKYRLAVFQLHISMGENKINMCDLWKWKEIETKSKQSKEAEDRDQNSCEVPHCRPGYICSLGRRFVQHSTPRFSQSSGASREAAAALFANLPLGMHCTCPLASPSFPRGSPNLDFSGIIAITIIALKFHHVSQDPLLGPCLQQPAFIFLRNWHPSDKLITLLWKNNKSVSEMT